LLGHTGGKVSDSQVTHKFWWYRPTTQPGTTIHLWLRLVVVTSKLYCMIRARQRILSLSTRSLSQLLSAATLQTIRNIYSQLRTKEF
jgi:hypothetical protein